MSSAAELVTKYSEDEAKLEDLVGFVKCQECFTSLFDEINEQLGSDAQIAVLLADQFPEMYQAYAKEAGLLDDDDEDDDD